MKTRLMVGASLMICNLALAQQPDANGYPPPGGQYPAQGQYQPAPVCNTCGIVVGIRAIQEQPQAQTQSNGVLGALAGGVVGALVGNGVGQGKGRTLATIAGAAGGAYAGNKIEKAYAGNGGGSNGFTGYEVTVQMPDGSTRTVRTTQAPQMGQQYNVGR